jgi:hypothetical protein
MSTTTFKKEKRVLPATSTHQSLSVEEIIKAGEKFYFEELKEKLERESMGQYAVIDVEQKKYRVDPNELVAIQKAQKDFGEKLFFIVQVGSLKHPSTNFTTQKYAWNFACGFWL